MVGGTWTEAPKPAPKADWISNKMWCTLCELVDRIPVFKGIDLDITNNIDAWTRLYNATNPQEAEWPGKW